MALFILLKSPPMTNNTQQLPAEVAKDIQRLAESKLLEMDRKIKEGVSEESRHHFLTGYTEGVAAGATEYATRLHQVQQEFGRVSTMFLDLDTKHEQARALLEKFISRHEAGLLPDRFIYNDIKSFLDGK
jgi:hypothetical protein